MDKFKNKVLEVLFTKSSEEQVKFVQKQIDCFKTYDTPIYNMKMLQFQLKIALIINFYLSYLLIAELNNLEDYFFNQSYMGTTWFVSICLQNVLIVIPKIVMMAMLWSVLNKTRNIDELIVNVEEFMKTKVYYYNCYISKYIWINYGIGGLYFLKNLFFGYQEYDQQIVSLCNHILYIMIARLILFIVKILMQSKGLTDQQLQNLINKRQFAITEEFCKKHEDICSVCLDNYEVGQISLQLDCKHIYHIGCIKTWLLQQNKCPCCNQFAFREL